MTKYARVLQERTDIDTGLYVKEGENGGEELVRKGTRLQTLVSCLNQNTTTLAAQMRIGSDCVVINECNENAYSEYAYGKYHIRCWHINKRGVGLSRNRALENCSSELLLFSDDDMVYHDGYAKGIEEVFDSYPLADMILFNVKRAEGRQTYHIESYGRVGFHNCGRYGAVSIAARTASLRRAGVSFSLLFGGGAPYSNGEDSLFLHDCLKKRLRLYHAPVEIGYEQERESTWFKGYTDKFFFDRGVLYHYLYGKNAYILGRRFLWKNRHTMCADKPRKECYELLKKGIEHAALYGPCDHHAPCGEDD